MLASGRARGRGGAVRASRPAALVPGRHVDVGCLGPAFGQGSSTPEIKTTQANFLEKKNNGSESENKCFFTT
jgi:hypothetical protein